MLVTDYVVGRNDAFIYGMKIVYLTAAAICMMGVSLTALRLFSSKARKKYSNKPKVSQK
jgi:hypothetical protein